MRIVSPITSLILLLSHYHSVGYARQLPGRPSSSIRVSTWLPATIPLAHSYSSDTPVSEICISSQYFVGPRCRALSLSMRWNLAAPSLHSSLQNIFSWYTCRHIVVLKSRSPLSPAQDHKVSIEHSGVQQFCTLFKMRKVIQPCEWGTSTRSSESVSVPCKFPYLLDQHSPGERSAGKRAVTSRTISSRILQSERRSAISD